MLHHRMVVRELEQFFGTDDPSQGITDTAEFTTNDRPDSLCQDSKWTQDSFFYSRLNWNVNIHTSEGLYGNFTLPWAKPSNQAKLLSH